MWLVELWHFIANIFGHAQYVLIYYVLGGKCIIHDMLYKRHNRVELKSKPKYVAIVTGGARGIGSGVVKMLMQCDMHVIIACREVPKGKEIIKQIRDNGVKAGSAAVLELELKSLKSVRQFATSFNAEHKYLNLLVNNAGIMFAPYEITEDGLESHFAVNYLGHFLLTQLLMPAMEEARKIFATNPRIVNVTSCAHEVSPKINFDDINMTNHFITQAAYAQSKLCQLMSTRTLDRKLKDNGSQIQVIAVHPGVVDTELFDGTLIKTITPWVLKFFCKSPKQGATSVTYCCIDDELENAGGSYYSNCCPIRCSSYANDVRTQEKLYEYSMQLVKPFLPKSV